MSTNNFTIEEMEDQAVKKSNIAKGIGITAAAAVVSTGTAYAATTMLSDQPTEEGMTADDVTAGMSNSTHTENTVHEHTHYSQPVSHTTHHVEAHHPAAPAPEPTSQESSMVADESVGYYIEGEDGPVEVGRIEKGTIDGVDYALIDQDGDGYANDVYYDKNRDHQFTEDEHVEVTTKDGIHMSDPNDAHHETKYVFVNPQPEGIVGPGTTQWNEDEKEYFVQKEDDKSDIKNDFDPTEKDDDVYSGDFADNNEDYQHDENVDDYYA